MVRRMSKTLRHGHIRPAQLVRAIDLRKGCRWLPTINKTFSSHIRISWRVWLALIPHSEEALWVLIEQGWSKYGGSEALTNNHMLYVLLHLACYLDSTVVLLLISPEFHQIYCVRVTRRARLIVLCQKQTWSWLGCSDLWLGLPHISWPVVASTGHKSAFLAFFQQPWLLQSRLLRSLLPPTDRTLEMQRNQKRRRTKRRRQHPSIHLKWAIFTDV